MRAHKIFFFIYFLLLVRTTSIYYIRVLFFHTEYKICYCKVYKKQHRRILLPFSFFAFLNKMQKTLFPPFFNMVVCVKKNFIFSFLGISTFSCIYNIILLFKMPLPVNISHLHTHVIMRIHVYPVNANTARPFNILTSMYDDATSCNLAFRVLDQQTRQQHLDHL